jgi:hypothetical protein
VPPGPYLAGLVQIRPQTTDVNPENLVHENVLYYAGDASVTRTVVQLTAVQAAFDTAWTALWGIYGSSAAHYAGSIVTDRSSSTGLEVDNSAFVPVVGSHGGGQLPNQVAILISHKIAQRYKGGHARTYLACVDASATHPPDSVATTDIPLLTAGFEAVTAAMSALTATDGGPYTFISLRGRRTVMPTGAPVVASVCNPLLATQRRRLRKAAHH